MDGPQIPKGFVAWENGVITQVGDMSRCPTPVSGQDVDAQGGYVLPGFVDVHCHLGLLADGLSYERTTATRSPTPAPRSSGSLTPSTRWTTASKRHGRPV